MHCDLMSAQQALTHPATLYALIARHMQEACGAEELKLTRVYNHQL